MQVFRNIIRNFVTYTNPGATLHINANHGPDFSVVSFADDGPGVQERELPLLFDTFYRGSGCGGKLGSGLGLSICRGIIEVHGGSIEASAGTEGGLLVTLKLPKKGEA